MSTRPIRSAPRLVAASAVALLLGSGCAAPGPAGPVEARPSTASTPVAEPSSTTGTERSAVAPTPSTGRTDPVADLVVEIHVPLTPTPGRGSDDYAYPWIDDIEAYLAGLDGSDGAAYDDGEELGDEYVFFVSDAPEADLIRLARRVSRLTRVPDGVYAVVNDSEGDLGEGRRVDLQ